MNKQSLIQDKYIKIATEFFKTQMKGYLDLAPRFGKIRTTFGILNNLFAYDCTILIAYPLNSIKDEWINEGIKWGYTNPNITYVNFSSLKNYKDKIFDFFIIDEFHSASDNERDICHQIMTNSDNMYTLLLSGTVSKETASLWELPLIAKYTTSEGINDGILSNYQITIHLVDLDDRIKTANKKGKLITEKQKYANYSFVIDKMKKNGQNFKHLALSRNRLALSSIAKKTYLIHLLKQQVPKRTLVFTGLADIADSLGIPSYHSKSKNDQNYKDFQENKVNQLALAAMGKMGVTFTNLDSVVLYNFSYNFEETKQILDRAIKLDYKSKIADLHIIAINEKPELKKLEETIKMFDKSKIKYI